MGGEWFITKEPEDLVLLAAGTEVVVFHTVEQQRIQCGSRIKMIQQGGDVAVELLRKIPVAREEVTARVVLLTKMKKSASIEMEQSHYVHQADDNQAKELRQANRLQMIFD